MKNDSRLLLTVPLLPEFTSFISIMTEFLTVSRPAYSDCRYGKMPDRGRLGEVDHKQRQDHVLIMKGILTEAKSKVEGAEQ